MHHVEQLAYGRQSATAQHLNLQDLALDYLDALERVDVARELESADEEIRSLKRKLENCNDELNDERDKTAGLENEVKELNETLLAVKKAFEIDLELKCKLDRVCGRL